MRRNPKERAHGIRADIKELKQPKTKSTEKMRKQRQRRKTSGYVELWLLGGVYQFFTNTTIYRLNPFDGPILVRLHLFRLKGDLKSERFVFTAALNDEF